MTDVNVLKHPELPGVEIYLTWVTPKIAEEFLDKNTEGQRNLNEDVAGRYAEDMANLNWLFTGSPILFDKAGELIDGQHRLNAIADSGEPQLCLIVAGLDHNVMQAVDAGRKRTYGTYLHMPPLSRPSYSMQAAVIRAMWYWRVAKNYGDRGISRIAIPSEAIHDIPTIAQLEACRVEFEEELGITTTAACQFAQRAYGQLPRITTTVWGLVWVLLTEYDVDARERFFHELFKEPLSPSVDYPPNALKARLGRQREPLTRTVQLHMVLRTFNAWQSGVRLQAISAPNVMSFNSLAMPPVKAGQ